MDSPQAVIGEAASEPSETDTQDKVYEMLLEEYAQPPAEKVPSLNGGMPITMTVKKNRAESLGGTSSEMNYISGLNKTGTHVQ